MREPSLLDSEKRTRLTRIDPLLKAAGWRVVPRDASRQFSLRARSRETLQTERLTQTVLAKAFCGELAPTEAELARAEGRDYEPAAVLLERIKAEREKAGGKAKRRC
jgi:hypothetical protein